MSRENGYVLGIDLGTSSLGSALIDPKGKRIVWIGARIFSPVFEGDHASGNEESRARQRRLARQQRRQTDRRRRRRWNVFRLLQGWGLLPNGEREEILPNLDAELYKQYPQTEILPYFLRARALDHALEPYELGRALYHLAQRRGFRGRTAKETDEDGGKIREQIEGLQGDIDASGSRTLGEYLSTLNPHEERLRTKRTHRKMYEAEFAAIWEAQQGHHSEALTPERREALKKALFDQRPLKPVDHLVGMCELEKGEKRAPRWMLETQHYRVLTAINNLRLIEPSGIIRPLEERERLALVDESRKNGRITFKRTKTVCGLPKGVRFSVEEGGEKNVPGNITSARMFDVLGNEWLEMTPERQRELVAELGDPKRHPTDEDLEKCLTEKWGLPDEIVQGLCGVSLPEEYVSLSLRAIEKVTPLLEQGLTFARAKRQLWPEQFEEKEPLELLPPVTNEDVLPELRNPVVIRALSEMRKVVNGVIRRYGKPAAIHIELARDMKRSREERRKQSKRNREREKQREIAKKELEPFCGQKPSRRDIEKYLLWEECHRQCPYTGEMISLQALFGEHPRFDVEHIIPFDRSLDDSFQNKTLCRDDVNRNKGKRTPWEAFGDTPEWEEMVQRVKAFHNMPKLRRFTMKQEDAEKLLEEFTSRQLNDTRYASRLAGKYVGLLFGIERPDNRRIVVCAGAVTAFLRRKWDLNRILHEKPAKTREDHRHHTVDAIGVAMASMGQIKALADAASRARVEGHRRFGSLADPWPDFREQAREMVLGTEVSHRPKRRLKGALHEETLYSEPKGPEGKKVASVRKPVTALTAREVEEIVDPRIREIVREAWLAVGKDAKKLEGNWPEIRRKKGEGGPIKIKRVRYSKRDQFQTIAKDKPGRTRHVIPGGNHHMEVWEELNRPEGKGRKWSYKTVSRLNAMERYSQGDRIVQRDHGPNCRFCFSLSEGDLVRATRPADEEERIWYVRTVRSRGSFELSPATDARKKQDVKSDGELWDVVLNTLMALGAQKVVVTPLGEVVTAHD